MKAANPYLNFNGNTEEAFNFYKTVFGGEFLGLLRFRDFGETGMQVPEGDRDKMRTSHFRSGTPTSSWERTSSSPRDKP